MKFSKVLLFSLYFLINYTDSLAQYITVNDSFTAQQLIQNVLVNSPCANVSNFSVKGDNFSGNQQSFGYFTKGTSNFPFSNGVVLSTGKAISTKGPNNSLLSEGSNSWQGDSDLEQAIGENNTINATILEFDFLPLTNKISFEYIFASEQYLTNPSPNQCNFSDGFAFLLKESTSSAYQNLAVVPYSNVPVKVTTVRGSGTICPAANTNYFDAFNGIEHATNFNGQTKILKAESNVTPGTLYHIKLVIADQGNAKYDSAIFLGGGSFKVGTDLGPDRLIARNNPLCEGEIYMLDATEPGNNTYKWFKDGTEIIGATNSTYYVTSQGVYAVEITLNNSSCKSTGEVTIEYIDAPKIKNTVTLTQCDDDNDGITTFDLTKLNNSILNNSVSLNNVVYYTSLHNAKNEINPIQNPTNFRNSFTNKLYARVINSFGCASYAEVNLKIANNPIPILNTITICDNDNLKDGFTAINISQEITPKIISILPTEASIQYYYTILEAANQINSIPNIFTNSNTNQTIFLRINNGYDCINIIPLKIKVIAFSPNKFENETLSICKGEAVTLSVSKNFSSFLWNNGVTSSSISVTQAGNYWVKVTNENGCEAIKTFLIIKSEPATIENIEISDFKGENNSIKIIVSGLGNYEYSIDGFNYQDSPEFINLFPFRYTVSVRDKNGCGIINKTINILDYPKFFTPNGDGYNDIWEIRNLHYYPNATIHIFDRFGKLIYSFKGNQPGWNGKLNQKDLIESDYWFTLQLNDRIIKGHFSLKR